MSSLLETQPMDVIRRILYFLSPLEQLCFSRINSYYYRTINTKQIKLDWIQSVWQGGLLKSDRPWCVLINKNMYTIENFRKILFSIAREKKTILNFVEPTVPWLPVVQIENFKPNEEWSGKMLVLDESVRNKKCKENLLVYAHTWDGCVVIPTNNYRNLNHRYSTHVHNYVFTPYSSLNNLNLLVNVSKNTPHSMNFIQQSIKFLWQNNKIIVRMKTIQFQEIIYTTCVVDL